MSDQDKTHGRAVLPEGNAARAALHSSWEANAQAWTSAVREQRIPSRRLGSDAAILTACERVLASSPSKRVLDVGCGEGWLSHALAKRGAQVLGIDGSERLIELARAATLGPRPARFEIVSYEQLRDDQRCAAGPFDLLICNFALLDDRVGETLAALAARVDAGGRVIIQTVHPWMAVSDRPYADEWRVETFAAFEERFPSTMPWYFRTMGSWIAAIADAGLRVLRMEEPLHPETARPLSLLLTNGAA